MSNDLSGSWSFIEHAYQGTALLDNNQNIEIEITLDGYYDVEIPLTAGVRSFTDIPDVPDAKGRSTLSATWISETGEHGFRLVFDNPLSELKIVDGALGSTIERWTMPPQLPQPNDMGTITGTKG